MIRFAIMSAAASKTASEREGRYGKRGGEMKQLEGAVDTGQEADAHRAGEAIVAPLRKRRLSGELYGCDPKIEALIAELAILPRDELIARAEITKRSDPGHIPSECL